MLFSQHREVDLPLRGPCVEYADPHLLAELVRAAEITRKHHAFHRIRQLDINAEFRYAADDTVIFFTDMIQHVLTFFKLFDLPLQLPIALVASVRPDGWVEEFVGGWMRQTAQRFGLREGRLAEAFHVVHTL